MLEVEKIYKTVSGGSVRIIAIDRKNCSYPVVGLLTRASDSSVESVESYTAEGKYYSGSSPSEDDLIVPEQYVKLEDVEELIQETFQQHKGFWAVPILIEKLKELQRFEF